MNQTEATQLVADALKEGLHETRLGDDHGFHSVWMGSDLNGNRRAFIVFTDAAALSVTVEILAQP